MGRLKHKRGRPSNYRKSLQKNPYWEKVKRKVRIRDKFQCIVCSKKIGLETHHITYYAHGKSIVGNELQHLEWLVTLCEKHHTEAHKSEHPLNPKNKNKLNRNQYVRNNPI